MQKNNRDAFLENVENNYSAFKTAELKKSKAEIYGDAYQIFFYENVTEYLEYTELDKSEYAVLAKDKDRILDNLYRHYMKNWDSTVSSDDNIADFLRDYINVNSERGSEM